jgi:hypothetical protein
LSRQAVSPPLIADKRSLRKGARFSNIALSDNFPVF